MEARKQLENTGVLTALRTSIKEVFESASSQGYDASTVKSALTLLVTGETSPNKSQNKANTSANSFSKQNSSVIHQMSMAELYSTYIDSHTLYEPVKPKKHDVKYLVSFT